MAGWSYIITRQCVKKLTFRVRRREVRDESALVALDNRANACRQTISCREDMQSHHRRGTPSFESTFLRVLKCIHICTLAI
jgi:hypothetical protein